MSNGSLALNVLDDGILKLSVRGHAHVGCEGGGWLPLAGSTWGSLLEHAVNLFKRKSLGLWNAEVGEDGTADTCASEQEENLGLQVCLIDTDKVWVDGANDGVPEPVGGGGETNTTRSDWEREDFSNDNPGAWTPGGGEEEDEDTDEGDLCGGVWMLGWANTLVGVRDTESGGNEKTDDHTNGTPEEELTTSESLNHVKRWWSTDNVDSVCGNLDSEWVVEKGGKELGTEVEDEVDTSPLLEHLECGTEDSTTKVGAWVED
jgi:hypothetical protein